MTTEPNRPHDRPGHGAVFLHPVSERRINMKRFLTLILIVLAVFCSLSGCGNEIEADLVFVNDSNAVIVEVVVDFQDRSGGSRNADSSPLRRGDSFGFEVGEYPVTMWVYDAPFEGFSQKELASFTISEAPPEGERWYVTARDGAGRLMLSADTQWPEGV